ncbi:hypothetical protein C4D60_Mb03t15410 [Musa balbisiana]|uniref:Uncharacterized protein n=1 Tax=Musa balbisiana TaxID=52838 RepID=A0A4S8JA32_MUSBA|nr:hypothetical protein C4D60_Mb03t15410 [Musa balbisiana]
MEESPLVLTITKPHQHPAESATIQLKTKHLSHIIAVNIQLSDDSDNEAEELRKNLNSYFQEIYVSEGEWEMPYPQKPQKEVIAAGLEEELRLAANYPPATTTAGKGASTH